MKSGRREFLRAAAAAAGAVSWTQATGCRTAEAVGGGSMMGFRAPPLDEVRIGFIGLGHRGPGGVRRLCRIPRSRIVAVCDVFEDRAAKAAADVVAAGHAKPDI